MTAERKLVTQIRQATNQIDFSATYAGLIAARELDAEHAARLSEFFLAFIIYYVINGDMNGIDDKVYDFALSLTMDSPTVKTAYQDVKREMGL